MSLQAAEGTDRWQFKSKLLDSNSVQDIFSFSQKKSSCMISLPINVMALKRIKYTYVSIAMDLMELNYLRQFCWLTCMDDKMLLPTSLYKLNVNKLFLSFVIADAQFIIVNVSQSFWFDSGLNNVFTFFFFTGFENSFHILFQRINIKK